MDCYAQFSLYPLVTFINPCTLHTKFKEVQQAAIASSWWSQATQPESDYITTLYCCPELRVQSDVTPLPSLMAFVSRILQCYQTLHGRTPPDLVRADALNFKRLDPPIVGVTTCVRATAVAVMTLMSSVWRQVCNFWVLQLRWDA